MPSERRSWLPYAIVGGCVVAVGVLIGGLLLTAHDGDDPTGKPELVQIEVRAKFHSPVRFGTKQVGYAPLIRVLPKSHDPIDVEAFVDHKWLGKQVVPDHDQLVDLMIDPSKVPVRLR